MKGKHNAKLLRKYAPETVTYDVIDLYMKGEDRDFLDVYDAKIEECNAWLTLYDQFVSLMDISPFTVSEKKAEKELYKLKMCGIELKMLEARQNLQRMYNMVVRKPEAQGQGNGTSQYKPLLIVEAKLQPIQDLYDFQKLKPTVKGFKCSCPFHTDENPSFHISTEYNKFNCFSCGEKGSSIDFVMLSNGLGFVEAVKHLAGN